MIMSNGRLIELYGMAVVPKLFEAETSCRSLQLVLQPLRQTVLKNKICEKGGFDRTITIELSEFITS